MPSNTLTASRTGAASYPGNPSHSSTSANPTSRASSHNRWLRLLVALAIALTLAGCSDSRSNPQGQGNASQTTQVTIGTMATEDMLPYWVAEQQELFASANIDARIIVFQSAQELSTAMAAGEIDMAMTDLMVSASLVAAGVPLQICWVTLGQTASEGRFGILAHPDSGVQTLADLAGVPVAIGSNTLVEYTFDNLMLSAGISADNIVYEEIKIVPVRYEMLVNNQVAAAAFPASLLYLGEQSGLILVSDDLHGNNISQTVMIARSDFIDSLAEASVYDDLKDIWNQAVELINANPESWRQLLVEKAQLPAPIADTYPVPTYPRADVAADWMVENVLEWMQTKGYLTAAVRYDAETGRLIRDQE
ncbi:MAG: ABC transporter substrate-binding protein [Coriobacteriia bacterium]|nr:ABC transporter substrate-binding protein [Coriobacteriia bacterium]